MTKYLAADDVIFLNGMVRQRYPDRTAQGHVNRQAVAGIVDSAFESFYGRPLHGTIYGQAAALMENVIRFHPFPDGNKRTALLAACSFLEANGHRVSIPPDTVKFVVGVARNTAVSAVETLELVDGIAVWLESMAAGRGEHQEQI